MKLLFSVAMLCIFFIVADETIVSIPLIYDPELWSIYTKSEHIPDDTTDDEHLCFSSCHKVQ